MFFEEESLEQKIMIFPSCAINVSGVFQKIYLPWIRLIIPVAMKGFF
jgi:hypothetical protein